MNYLEKISKLSEKNILSLDEIVLWALELFEITNLKKINIAGFKKILIAGSGNAIVTAKIIFSEIDAIYCDETSFDKNTNKDFDLLVILSASWEKHATMFAKKSIKKWIKTLLITCNENSSAWKILWKENTIITLKNKEPYTYNVSTYMWWIIAYTWEKATEIKKFIQEIIDPILKKIDFSKYDSYILITPDNFSLVNQLFIVKFIELFGRKIARDVFSYEQMKHATTVIPHNGELCITFWEWEIIFKWNKLNFPLPKECWLWTIMAIWYYIIWKIQNSYPQYFKDNIWDYINNLNKTEFWKGLKVIVE